ncbi:hypothetical protein RIM59_06850 [Lactococcus lactis subsp. lactis]|uniref:hypothetical protein n=1 Tax=Lactococcus lactis TaxID=1358 RepID=UPI0006402213|nr:hypothetical protein [Lactococcus lactis]KLK95414.1 hypothetical protein VN91_2328 [Lactococcus lactis subsp. lactis]MDV4192200.1 hypothetical protein [Lactococcus lactis subsp. lactis]
MKSESKFRLMIERYKLQIQGIKKKMCQVGKLLAKRKSIRSGTADQSFFREIQVADGFVSIFLYHRMFMIEKAFSGE